MFCANKNSYLQLVCSMNPRIINNAVEQAMLTIRGHCVEAEPVPLDSKQPSLYCPQVDVTRANVGFGRIGLRNLIRDLHTKDPVVQLQALHSIMDKVQISENAMILINLNLVRRLTDLMRNDNPCVREKVCMIYTHLAGYYQGRRSILLRPAIVDNLQRHITEDIKEIRYVAACTLLTLSRYICTCQVMLKHDSIVENLLKKVKHDHVGIVIVHLKTLANLTQFNAERTIKANAFKILRVLFHSVDERIVSAAMDVMAQICKHDVGRVLSDVHYITWKVRKFLTSDHISVVNSAVGILQFTTLTDRAKFRAREVGYEMSSHLVNLCYTPSKPQLQLRAMQVLLNLTDSPDIRGILKAHWIQAIRAIQICSPHHWDGGIFEMTSPGLDSGHYYRPIEEVDDNSDAVNGHNYVRKLRKLKDDLIKAVESKPYRD